MSSEDEYDLFDSGRGATLFEDAKAPFDGSPEIFCGAEVQVGFDDTSLDNITSFQKIAQQSTIKGKFFKFRCKLTSDNNKVRAKVHKSKTAFTIRFYNSSNTGISRTFDYQIVGFGLKS
jgi:hypothetical protein